MTGDDVANDDSGTDDDTTSDAGDTPTGDAAAALAVCDPNGNGACQNAEDCAEIESDAVQDTAAMCAAANFGDPDALSTCLADETNISAECADCQSGLIVCSTANCIQPCVADQASDECRQCLVDADCLSDYENCSGLGSP